MNSSESDDEPLAVLAAAKKKNPGKFVIPSGKIIYEPKRKRKKPAIITKESPFKKLPLTIQLSRKLNNEVAAVVQRPSDVWLYLKDLKTMGPFTCLLCSEWFINRSKIVLHYVLNHKKDFCGICKYFVSDKQAWANHQKFHSPWPCSQCVNNYETETELRHHFSEAHGMVHCQLCHFRLTNDQYAMHLQKKHNATHNETEALLTVTDNHVKMFTCLLCHKPNLDPRLFFNHYMGYHRFTLQCLTSILSNLNTSMKIPGAEVSAEFIEGLQGKTFGYVNVDLDQIKTEPTDVDITPLETEFDVNVKEEVHSEQEEDANKNTGIEGEVGAKRNMHELVRTYRGDNDFDVTLMELILLEKCYSDYVSEMLNVINSNTIPENSDICYEDAKCDRPMNVKCGLCESKFETAQAFVVHMYKMHSVKLVPIYSCRVCVATFETQQELNNHISEELGDFDDLWLCQFCDKEFDNRQTSRRHLTEHWGIIEADNCFSPHMGFKCKYCPTLFWNETDREIHQVRAHFDYYKKFYYTCKVDDCSEVFSDKIWFIHHYLQHHYNSQVQYLVKCCICSLVLPSIEQMRSHFKAEHPDARKVFCSLDSCQYRPLCHRKSFLLHLKSLHRVVEHAPRVYPCLDCGRTFTNSRAMSIHASQAHFKAKLSCKLCNLTLKSNDERKLHYLIDHPGRHPFECSVCGKSFQYKSTMYMHKRIHAPNKEPLTCTYCHKTFEKKDSFREHQAIHEGPRHACSYCPMRFVQRSNMVRHERRHTGERPYVCPHCPRTFSDKGACNSHAKTHTQNTPFVCMYCGKTFAQKSKLTYHIRKHTGENLESCPVCSKIFTSGCSLREHMKIHDPERKTNVPCPLCDRKYQDERYMLRHLRTSHSFRQYECPLCSKTLTSVAGLRTHILTHSSLNIFRCKCCPKTYNVRRTMVKHLRKRHSLKLNNEKIKNYYTKLDPSECELPLDQETLKNIFGPIKRNENVLVANFVDSPIPNTSKTKDNIEQDGGDDENERESKNGSDSENETANSDSNEDEQEVPQDSKELTYQRDDNNDPNEENALEPSDFVTVKIEPVEEHDVDV